ncbi:MAG: hypothetical protein HY316_06230 [Acidobacteria bacterium]|nr:hypothetical protein [Acidobacteriota bacterium]
MPAQIDVVASRKGSRWECQVRVAEAGGRTTHRVVVEEADRNRLVGAAVPVERLVEKSFEFLLAREPKESILRAFDLPVIARYFPEYEREIRTMV